MPAKLLQSAKVLVLLLSHFEMLDDEIYGKKITMWFIPKHLMTTKALSIISYKQSFAILAMQLRVDIPPA